MIGNAITLTGKLTLCNAPFHELGLLLSKLIGTYHLPEYRTSMCPSCSSDDRVDSKPGNCCIVVMSQSLPLTTI